MPAVPRQHQVSEDLSDKVRPSVPRRRLEVLSLPTDSEDAPVGARLPCFVQAWHNLLGEHRSTWTLRSCVLLEWKSSLPLTRIPIQFPMKNKKSELQEGVDSLLKKGACSQEPLPGLLQQVISCSKEDSGSMCCNRSVHSQPASGCAPFRDGDCTIPQGGDMGPRVGSTYRHEGRLSPRPHQSGDSCIFVSTNSRTNSHAYHSVLLRPHGNSTSSWGQWYACYICREYAFMFIWTID